MGIGSLFGALHTSKSILAMGLIIDVLLVGKKHTHTKQNTNKTTHKNKKTNKPKPLISIPFGGWKCNAVCDFICFKAWLDTWTDTWTHTVRHKDNQKTSCLQRQHKEWKLNFSSVATCHHIAFNFRKGNRFNVDLIKHNTWQQQHYIEVIYTTMFILL